jgi:hypothetical protein
MTNNPRSNYARRLHDRQIDTLNMHWPIERPAMSFGCPSFDIENCIACGWLYREDIGGGWVRIGITPAGLKARAKANSAVSVRA